VKILLVGIYDTNSVTLAPYVLASFLKKHPDMVAHSIVIKEYSIFNQDESAIVEYINDQEKPDLVGFSVYIWNFAMILRIVDQLKIKVILGGPQVTGIEVQLIKMHPAIDIIATGESEETFKEIIEYYQGSRALESINGITTINFQSPKRDALTDLDSIPSIYKDIFNKQRDISWISFETSRGCPHRCKYCTWSQSRRVRYYSVDRVKADLDIILDQPNVKEIYLCDSSILFDKDRGIAILQYIAEKKCNKSIRFEFDPIQLDKAVIAVLKDLPSHEYNFGIQSTNKEALTLIGRKFDKLRFEKNYNDLVSLVPDPKITIDLIYGLPGDNIAGYKKSLSYALGFEKVTRVLTNPLILLPGSELYKNKEVYKIKIRDESSYIVTESFSFSAKEMHDAIKCSFYIYVIFFNDRVRELVLQYARCCTDTNSDVIDVLVDIMDAVPIDLTNNMGYPYTIPSASSDFEHRNNVLKHLFSNYHVFVNYLKTRLGKLGRSLNDYENSYTEYYYKLTKLIKK
jgi:hypothetical protein